jgi:hypothetical protein
LEVARGLGSCSSISSSSALSLALGICHFLGASLALGLGLGGHLVGFEELEMSRLGSWWWCRARGAWAWASHVWRIMQAAGGKRGWTWKPAGGGKCWRWLGLVFCAGWFGLGLLDRRVPIRNLVTRLSPTRFQLLAHNYKKKHSFTSQYAFYQPNAFTLTSRRSFPSRKDGKA